ncbi:MAG: 16S rRNA (adenine(1518)-N(6)/adenine(1519)-N(6))-dimethyltransferase RsmA [Candidatus Thermoplasmatota archaeon]
MKLGQNFLIDKKIADKEIAYAKIKKDDIVLEIGPGKGILTKRIAKKAKKVIAVEIDKKLVKKLKKNLPKNTRIINKDILDLDFKKINFNKVVSNLPFQISSPLTFKLLKTNFDLAIMLYQQEFAKRMTAEPGEKNYSRLSVGVYYKAKCKILKKVPKSCFFPQPKVDSCIVKLVPRKKPLFKVHDENFFFKLTRDLFNHRRKKIRNTLKNKYGIKNFEDILFTDKRVEKLSPRQIGMISNEIFKRIKKS